MSHLLLVYDQYEVRKIIKTCEGVIDYIKVRERVGEGRERERERERERTIWIRRKWKMRKMKGKRWYSDYRTSE